MNRAGNRTAAAVARWFLAADERVTAVAQGLDDPIARVLREAAQ
jgi:hypothetical protein